MGRRWPDGGPGRRAGRPTGRRIARRVGLVLAMVVAVLAAGAGTASAEGYRYWSFWTQDGDGDGGWVYATQGPSLLRPGDSTLAGFRFSISEDSGDAARPRGTADFATVCGDTPAESGRKRIALVIDFGTAAHAPSGEAPPRPRTACAVVPEDASAAEALAATAKPLRYNSSALLCAIAGYPRKGCGEQVSVPEEKSGERSGDGGPAGADGGRGEDPGGDTAADGDGGGPSLGLVAGAAVVVALGGGALWQARRRRG